MNFGESIVFYLVIGIAVAVAQSATDRVERPFARLATALGACVFWPLYLPLLLSRPETDTTAHDPTTEPRDNLARAIEQVEHELNSALAGLDGWAEGVLHAKPHGLRELRSALMVQAERIRDMDTLVARESTGDAHDNPFAIAGDDAPAASERCHRSQQARKENLERLDGLRHRARGDLLATLAWIRELVSMIHLAKFTGAPAARAEELVAQIAAAVESISSLSPTEGTDLAMPSSNVNV
ncbi:MAG TPA: hypothetical protein VHV77_07910 [Pirellulales bacterium]|nr:hypothetical protein [Pirellulales bacterium]